MSETLSLLSDLRAHTLTGATESPARQFPVNALLWEFEALTRQFLQHLRLER